MKAEYKQRLQLNWTFLEKNLNVDEILEHCYERGVLVMTDRERIMGEPSRPDRVLKFLHILMAQPDDRGYDVLQEVLCLPDVGQPFIRRRLSETELPQKPLPEDSNQQLLEQIISDCFVVQKDSDCLVEHIIRIIRVQLRHQQKCLDIRSSDVFALIRSVYPQMVLRKHRKKKHVVAIQNCKVKPELVHVAESYDDEDDDEEYTDTPAPIPMEKISPEQVAEVMRPQLEREGQDIGMAARMEEEEIDGKSLVQLTEGHIEKLFPDLKMGKRIRLMDAVKGAIAELQKPPEIAIRPKKPKPRRKLETFRAFDTRPRATDVYEKGHVLPEEQSRPGYLLEPLHKYRLIQANDLATLASEAVQFAAACMNERVNGTIHFGVLGKCDCQRASQAGEIVGFPLNKQQCELAVTDEIYRAFFDEQREVALKSIRDPVYIPVVSQEAASAEIFVVEVDVIPHSEVVGNEAFFLKPASGKQGTALFRYIDGGPTEVFNKELLDFMNCKKQQTSHRRTTEQDTRARAPPSADLHRKLHGLLTDGNDFDVVDIFPVLFLSPLPDDISTEYLVDNFCCIKSLQPLAVFDFDPPHSDSSRETSTGLYPVMENHFGQVYEALTTDNFDKDSEENKNSENKDGLGKLLESLANSSFRPWILCNGYGPLGKEELKPTNWRSQRGQGFKEALRFYKEEIPSEKARILIFLLSRNYDVLLGALEEIFVKFPDQWILVAETEKVAKDLMAEVVRRMYVEKEAIEERCVIGMPWSHVNASIMKIFGYSVGTGCTLPSSTGSPCVMKERDKNGLPDLEILSMTQCTDEDFVRSGSYEEIEKRKRAMEEEFYRGKQVSWWNFFFQDHVLRRSQFDKFKDAVKAKLDDNIPDDEKVAVVTLFHQPGAGGSTTARQILWELRKEFRCCVVKHIPDPRQTCEQIATLRNFEEPENPKPPLVLIDNEDEEKVFQLCSYMNEKARREARDSRGKQKIFCVLVICVRMTVLPKKKDESKVGIMLGHDLEPEEAAWFRSKYEILEERFKKKQLSLHPKLLISFNILKENFNPDYIRRTVDEFVSEIKDFKEKQLLKYIALINSFDPDFQLIPISCFNVIMSPVKDKKKGSKPRLERRRHTTGDTHWEASLSTSLNVLLNRTQKRCLGADIKAVRIINNNLSRAILNNLCSRDKQTVSDVILEFLHTEIFRRSNESSVQTQLVKIVKDILKKRAPMKKGRAKFSPIILEIGKNEDFEQAAEVLKVGFNRFDDPMIAQQIARVYIHCSNWKEADAFARVAQDMKPKNSYLCDTHGQVYKEQLIGRWKECLENEEQLEGDKANEIIDIALKAIEIFRREQKLSDADCSTGYNNCGFFSELRALVTLLDCCRFLKAFKCDKGELLHKFLVNEHFIPDGLNEELGEDRVKLLKRLYHEYEKPMRRLEDEQIQLKEDSCYQYSPSYTNSIQERRMFVHLQECLDTYFGEDKDEVPAGGSPDDACEYRRRRVKRRGGNSLRSIYGLRDEENAAEEFGAMHKLIERNVDSPYCNAFDLKTILNITLARVSKADRRCLEEVPLERALDWTQQLYDKSKLDTFPYLEAFLYLVMFNWPTEWRNKQRFEMVPCSKIKDVIKEWKEAFQNNHPAQKEEEGKKPDRRKGTTLFFLGEGEGFEEIVFYSELQGFNRRHIGDSIWDTKVARTRLKRLKGTLLHEGKEMSVTIMSPKGSHVQLVIPTSYPIKDHSLWQKSVRFVLGFCWSGPKAYSVTRDDRMDLNSAHTPLNFQAHRRNFDHKQQKMMSQQAVEQFWIYYFDNQTKLEKLEKDLRFCSTKKQERALQYQKKRLERDRDLLVQKRTSVLQGPD
ncbi:sterile alpha motif domain-containing protein 9-like [Littorina saxatilis]|uniref:CARD domain-containing protein n=1 Tax=Littorina saxatilis TaxID=31220 RepID=A0AAN9BLI2_9CAEN